MTAHGELPSVCAVIPTVDRPQLLRRAVQAALAQDYSGPLQILVVIDQREGAPKTPIFDDPKVTVITNSRAPGLAGARNSGIIYADTDLIAFCDDDDAWAVDKVRRQVAALDRHPDAVMATTAVSIDFDGSVTARRAGTDLVTHDQLLPSRLAMLHSSTFLIRREALLGRLGLVDEHVPGSQNEDWDLLLRASQRHPIVHVDDPLVTIQWAARSYFNRDWETKISSLEWMLERHPDIAASAKGSARVYGQIAFGHAASGQRRTAWRWAARAIRRRWKEPRAYLALLVACGGSADWVLRTLHKRGHGV